MAEKENSSKQSDKLKLIIEKGSEVGGSVSGAVIGLAIAGPVGAIAGAAVGPIVGAAFNKIGTEISEKIMGPREQARIGATYSLALEKIALKLEKGMKVRNDDFFTAQENDRSKSESILEGTFLKARNEYEEKKIKCYSNFLANLSFDSSISFEKGNALLRILEQLTFRQLSILAYFSKIEELSTKQWMESFKDNEKLGQYQDFYFELMDIYNKQLLQQPRRGFAMSATSLGISQLGKTMCDLIGVDEISESDILKITNTIDSVNCILERSATTNKN
ncbi:hypothetical protein [Marinifilum fragile]|uniref:hypothetical protein n=1 Tax=Marinifilum fragile TaxID=570161 RepID=UPI002AABF497|nr:hypothetical protein [Marinifilum fragile]